MHIVIIGNGISGITTARFIRKLSDHKITVISGESDHFFSRTALMYIYMGHMRYEDTKPYEDWFWTKNRIDLKRAWVERVDFDQKNIHFQGGSSMAYDKLVLATGSQYNKFGWPGQDLPGVGGMVSIQDYEAMEAATEQGIRRAVIVGGGLIGIEMAECFHARGIPVTFLVREKSYWNGVLPPEESEMVSRHIKSHHIDLRLGEELDEILDLGTGRVQAVTTKSGEQIECDYVGLTAGVHPRIDFLKDSGLELGRGIKVNNHLQTNIPDVYAIGDCAELKAPRPGRRPIEAIWYTGRMMGETAAYNICGTPTEYDPGIWFNSAKFLDLEYQVYGEMPAKLPDHLDTIYWEHADGEKGIRLVYTKEGHRIRGFNLMGIRYRHEVCERWIAENTPLEDVLQHLSLANFDPEFYEEYEGALLAFYQQKTGKQLVLKSSRTLDQVTRFLQRALSFNA